VKHQTSYDINKKCGRPGRRTQARPGSPTIFLTLETDQAYYEKIAYSKSHALVICAKVQTYLSEVTLDSETSRKIASIS